MVRGPAGNRRTDSFRNIIAQPRIAAALLIPGSHRIVRIAGTATLTTDEAARERFAVRDKVPRLAVRIDDLRVTLGESAALARAPLAGRAAARRHPSREDVRRAYPAQPRQGLGARIASAVTSIPGLMQKGLDKDYHDNLY